MGRDVISRDHFENSYSGNTILFTEKLLYVKVYKCIFFCIKFYIIETNLWSKPKIFNALMQSDVSQTFQKRKLHADITQDCSH